MSTRTPAERCIRTSSTRRGYLRTLAVVNAIGIGWLGWPSVSRAAVDPATVPESKRMRAGRYLLAAEVPAFIAARGGPAKVLFLDVRTRAEAMYVGTPGGVDALVPYAEHQETMIDWDAKRGSYRLEALPDFLSEVQRRLHQKRLDSDDPLILICRSGDRSARAANWLAQDGFTRVWSVVDGFEGDMGQDGRRSVNGWKNAGLPWSYQLNREKMYFPRGLADD
ncbi:rhodanese-like domain-containing protein [Ottowia sp.]|uniref:rhodanese-like domain-containing protein n=1 Tax=Ottowia sp. TaxID=1898956 RepID=UPI002CC3C9A2|nr:rhodanese-like domain-containing protein [Ottowia sp.]HRN76836.1 rhodanese-like domain-containing protein [Ottowia sp.]HRQ03883.1 rhodanese-like domain-containing protein [Ottowia sp.]